MLNDSFAVLVSVQISQTKGTELEDSPGSENFLDFLRFREGVFSGLNLRTLTSSSSSPSERSMKISGGSFVLPRDSMIARWRSLSWVYCSTEMALDLLVPLSEMGVKQKASTSTTSIGGGISIWSDNFGLLMDLVSRFTGPSRLIGGESIFNFNVAGTSKV